MCGQIRSVGAKLPMFKVRKGRRRSTKAESKWKLSEIKFSGRNS